jgi:RNA polymerase sigma-70 factor (ECF subfamily)
VHQPLSNHEALVIAELPKMFKFAMKLCKNKAAAEDLVQETVFRALKYHAQFTEGTVIGAWMWAIMRNQFLQQHRKAWRTVEDPDGMLACQHLTCPADQLIRLEAKQALDQVRALPEDVSKIMLMFGDGATYEEVVSELMIPMGTVKSRLSRARALLDGRGC